jgi:hypothetical protein
VNQTQRKSCRRVFTPLAFSIAIAACLAGCQARKIEKLVPVKGKVVVNGAPLTSGAVTFQPDGSKGNQSLHIPVGTLDSQGQYELTSATQKGAPRGWYKVSISAQEPIDPKNPYAPPKHLINARYADTGTSGLAVEVQEKVPPGSYDFQVTK